MKIRTLQRAAKNKLSIDRSPVLGLLYDYVFKTRNTNYFGQVFNGALHSPDAASFLPQERLLSLADSLAKRYGHDALLYDVVSDLEKKRDGDRLQRQEEADRRASASIEQHGLNARIKDISEQISYNLRAVSDADDLLARNKKAIEECKASIKTRVEARVKAAAERRKAAQLNPANQKQISDFRQRESASLCEALLKPYKISRRRLKRKRQDHKTRIKELQAVLKAALDAQAEAIAFANPAAAMPTASPPPTGQKVKAMAPAMSAKPSMQSRRKMAGARAKLHAVPPRLRAEVAELINRLVMRGPAGGAPTPIPRYDKSKLVKRLLARRPLPNALQEDVIAGRPVTLLLPDISPSCARQAQTACDLANAAGYAGVPGSDVLIFPHSNGCVDGDDPSFLPWFNGRPLTVVSAEVPELFNAATEGTGVWRIEAVLAIGDHDAYRMYAAIADLPQVRRLVWLHNRLCPRPAIEPLAFSHGSATAGAEKKTTLVYGCTNQKTMLQGLKLALR